MSGTGLSWIEIDSLSSLVSLTSWRPAVARSDRSDGPPVDRATGALAPRFEAHPASNVDRLPEVTVPTVIGRIDFEGPIEDRLERLVEWSATASGTSAAFVTDDEGLMLASSARCAIPAAATTLVDTFLRGWAADVGRPQGYLFLRGEHDVCVVTWVVIGRGTYFLVVVGSQPGHPDPERLTAALSSALEEVQR